MDKTLLDKIINNVRNEAEQVIPDECQREMFVGDLEINISLIDPADTEKILDKLFAAYFCLGSNSVQLDSKYISDMQKLRKLIKANRSRTPNNIDFEAIDRRRKAIYLIYKTIDQDTPKHSIKGILYNKIKKKYFITRRTMEGDLNAILNDPDDFYSEK